MTLERNTQFRVLAWFFNHPEKILTEEFFAVSPLITDSRAVWLLFAIALKSDVGMWAVPAYAADNGHGSWIWGFIKCTRQPDYPQDPAELRK
jgi:hypothetical protein